MSTVLSLPGVAFPRQHGILLRALQNTHRYPSNVWVARQLVSLLQLTLRRDAHPAVCLTAGIDTGFFHNSSQFLEPLQEQQHRWQTYRASLGRADDAPLNGTRYPLLAAAPVPLAAGDADTDRPRSTNGEPFPPAVERQMTELASRRQAAGAPASVYWVSPAEASFIFQSPVKEEILRDEAQAVGVPSPFCSARQPLPFFNAADTVRPEVYTPDNCRRYDPYNYCGAFYTPYYATLMKRFAVEHGCVHQARWLTPRRIRWMGGGMGTNLNKAALSFVVGDATLLLVNVAMTRYPDALEAACLNSPTEEELLASEDHKMLVEGAVVDAEAPVELPDELPLPLHASVRT